MNASQAAMRRASALRTTPGHGQTQRQWARFASGSSGRPPSPGGKGKLVGFATVFGGAAATAYYWPSIKASLVPQPEAEPAAKAPKKAKPRLEAPRMQSTSKEDNRDIISSQHLQVKNSWEHPGVYLWGSNTGRVVDPDSSDRHAKLPRRFAYFNDQLLRDLKLSQTFGAAITESGDLVQWGLGFSKTNPKPLPTLRGKDLVKIDISADRILALSKSGAVYSVPASRDDQDAGAKQESLSSSWSLWNAVGMETVSYRDLTPKNLGRGEKVVDVSSGLHHCLLLTSQGRVFSAASSAADFPSRGQMGVPGLTWATRPQGPYDQAHEILTLKGFGVEKIATGDYHSVALDKTGRVFSFGDNTFGQLGFDSESSFTSLDSPAMVPFNKLYAGSGRVPRVASIAAGGLNTFFAIDAATPTNNVDPRAIAPSRRMPPRAFDLWSAGQGVYGSLGTGKWTHVSVGPTKVKALSSLFEFDELANKMMPIKLKALSVGSTHAAAVMDNVTETSVSSRASEHSTNWGADVLFWGGNEHYQLGTGKRTNMNAPTYIGPLDGGEADADKGRKGEVHRLCLTPRQTAKTGEDGKGRKVTLEQKVECGQHVTGVYSST